MPAWVSWSGSGDPGLGDDPGRCGPASPPHGTLALNSNGSFTYTPALNYGGPDSFTFHGYDGLNGGNVATVTLQVADTTPPVVTNPGSQLNTEGDSVNLPQPQASDPNGSCRDLVGAIGMPPGLGISQTSGQISGTVVSTFLAARAIQRDGLGERCRRQHRPRQLLAWTVNNVAPTVVNHVYAVAKNTPLFVNGTLGVLSGSSDPGGETTPGGGGRHRLRTARWPSTATARSRIPRRMAMWVRTAARTTCSTA